MFEYDSEKDSFQITDNSLSPVSSGGSNYSLRSKDSGCKLKGNHEFYQHLKVESIVIDLNKGIVEPIETDRPLKFKKVVKIRV